MLRPDSFRAVLAALSTGHKVGMLVAAGLFIAFALASSFVFPRYWPQFPGGRGLSAHIVVSLALFVAMVLAVELFAVEEEEARAGDEPAAVAEEEPPAETGGTVTDEEEAPAETGGGTGSPETVTVAGTEFAFALPSTELDPGPYVFEFENEGQIGHDLAIEGPGVEGEKTPVIDPGERAEVEVDLRAGSYDLYCTVPGHREAGMETTVAVS
jgi:uncharacterized cupredoxin-like copper-binding protein